MTVLSVPRAPGDRDYNGNKLATDNMVRQAREETVDLAIKLVSEPICNVQRDASNSGGTVEVIFQGFLPK